MMTTYEAIRIMSLIIFTALLAVTIVMMRSEDEWYGWGVSVGAWAINNILFYIAVLFFGGAISIDVLNAWSAITKVHGAVLVIGGMIIISRKRVDRG